IKPFRVASGNRFIEVVYPGKEHDIEDGSVGGGESVVDAHEPTARLQGVAHLFHKPLYICDMVQRVCHHNGVVLVDGKIHSVEVAVNVFDAAEIFQLARQAREALVEEREVAGVGFGHVAANREVGGRDVYAGDVRAEASKLKAQPAGAAAEVQYPCARPADCRVQDVADLFHAE